MYAVIRKDSEKMETEKMCKKDVNDQVRHGEDLGSVEEKRQALPEMIMQLNAEQMAYVISHLSEALSEPIREHAPLVHQ